MSKLPFRIMHMVKALHDRGHTSLYLYSGMSPSGGSWRYKIGMLVDNQWPAYPAIVSGSLGGKEKVDWACDNSTVDLLTDGFERYYADYLSFKYKPTAYSNWYARLLSSLADNELLVFFADYGGAHRSLLETAPGYHKK